MSYTQLVYIHLSTIVPAFLLGTFLLLNRKGTPLHRMLGKLYMVLMGFTALVTLLMQAEVGPRFFGHLGYIHLLSLLVIVTVPKAWLAARRGDTRQHKYSMISLYIGGLLIAGGFALMPGRMLYGWLFS